MTTPLDDLRALRAAGRLESSPDEVRALLAVAGESGRVEAEALVAGFDAAAIPPALDDRRVRVAVLGSGTVKQIAAPLRVQLLRHGLVPDIVLGGFGLWGIEMRSPGHPLFDPAPDLTVCVLDPTVVTGRLRAPWTAEDLLDAIDAALTDIRCAVESFGTERALLLTTIPLPPHVLGLLVDLESRARVAAAWRRADAELLDLAAQGPRLQVVDVDSLLYGTGPLRDERLAAYAGMEVGEEVLREIARHVGHLVRASRGLTRKCLALDLDGTVWGGVLVDDGPEGLVMGDGPRGRAHTALQDAAIQLASQGVLPAVLSKNDDAEVRAVLRDDPRMRLREDDLVGLVADWNPKPGNLGLLADRLNLGTDAFVFIDDSPSECGLMRSTRPEVEVIEVNASEPALHVAALLRDSWFLTARVTDEDRARTGRYRQEARREELRAGTESVEDYLAALGTEVDLVGPGPGEVARLAQITQRTNQFNLTTIRMDEDEVRRWIDDPDLEVVAVRCADHFGDHGLVGAVFLQHEGATTHVRNLALSCRVLARGVETAVLGYVVDSARHRGAHTLVGWYSPSPRNGRVAEFYPDHGFAPGGVSGEGPRSFILPASEPAPSTAAVRVRDRQEQPA